MQKKSITPNKNSWNIRRVEELSKEIEELEKKRANTRGFFRKLRLDFKIDKLIKQRSKHGEEALEYERQHLDENQ